MISDSNDINRMYMFGKTGILFNLLKEDAMITVFTLYHSCHFFMQPQFFHKYDTF